MNSSSAIAGRYSCYFFNSNEARLLSAQACLCAISKEPFLSGRLIDQSGLNVWRLKAGDRFNERCPTTAATRATLQMSEFLNREDQIFSFGHITQSLGSEMVAHGGRHGIT